MRLVTAAQPCEGTRTHQAGHFTWVNDMGYELYLSKLL